MRGFIPSCLLSLAVLGLCLAQAPATLAAAPENQPVLIRMEVPVNAEVWFDGAATTQTGSVREYLSPALAPDKNYTYQVRIRWMQDGKPVEQDRSLRVRAGQQVNVDVTQQNVSVNRKAYYPPAANPMAAPTTWYSSSSYGGSFARPGEPSWEPYDWNDYLKWNITGTD